MKHDDGYYYFTATVPEYDRIELRRSKSVIGLRDAKPKRIWSASEETGMTASYEAWRLNRVSEGVVGGH